MDESANYTSGSPTPRRGALVSFHDGDDDDGDGETRVPSSAPIPDEVAGEAAGALGDELPSDGPLTRGDMSAHEGDAGTHEADDGGGSIGGGGGRLPGEDAPDAAAILTDVVANSGELPETDTAGELPPPPGLAEAVVGSVPATALGSQAAAREEGDVIAVDPPPSTLPPAPGSEAEGERELITRPRPNVVAPERTGSASSSRRLPHPPTEARHMTTPSPVRRPGSQGGMSVSSHGAVGISRASSMINGDVRVMPGTPRRSGIVGPGAGNDGLNLPGADAALAAPGQFFGDKKMNHVDQWMINQAEFLAAGAPPPEEATRKSRLSTQSTASPGIGFSLQQLPGTRHGTLTPQNGTPRITEGSMAPRGSGGTLPRASTVEAGPTATAPAVMTSTEAPPETTGRMTVVGIPEDVSPRAQGGHDNRSPGSRRTSVDRSERHSFKGSDKNSIAPPQGSPALDEKKEAEGAGDVDVVTNGGNHQNNRNNAEDKKNGDVVSGTKQSSMRRFSSYSSNLSLAGSKSRQNRLSSTSMKKKKGSGILKYRDRTDDVFKKVKNRKKVHFQIAAMAKKNRRAWLMRLANPTASAVATQFHIITLVYEGWAIWFRLALMGRWHYLDLAMDCVTLLSLMHRLIVALKDDYLLADSLNYAGITLFTDDDGAKMMQSKGQSRVNVNNYLESIGALKDKKPGKSRKKSKKKKKETIVDEHHIYARSTAKELRGFPVALIVMGSLYVSEIVQLVSPKYAEMVFFLCNAVRCSRIFELFAYFRRKEMDLHTNMRRVALLKFLCMVFGLSHIVGCFGYFLARLSKFSGRDLLMTWVAQYKDFSPGYDYDYNNNLSFTQSVKVYLLIMYTGFCGLTNMGYEQTDPQRWEEMLFTIVVVIMQIILEAYILGTLFHYIVKKDQAVENFRKRLLMLEEYGETRQLPNELRGRLRKHFEFQYEKTQKGDTGVLSLMPSSLKMKVAFFQYEDVMERNMFLFKGCNAQFLNMLVVTLREMYLMPGETVIQQRDMSRELIFVRSGALELLKNSQLIGTVRSDSDLPSVVGEVPFFMSIAQPYTVKARSTSDATCLMMSKLDFEELKLHYPEQQDIINTNILARFDLNKDGTNVNLVQSKEDDDPERVEMREQIQSALLKRYADSLSNITYAASEGDVDTVRSLLHRGLPVDSGDYDLRTTLHLAAVEGNLKVVEVLIEEGANVNVKDRWGQTPLQDAVNMGHGQVIELLQKHGGKLDYEDPSNALCSAASAGDLKKMKQLIDNGIDPNCGDYDARTAFHLASAEGKLKVTDYLLSVGANVNIQDRWDGTPLEDAIKSGQEVCSMLLLEHSATLRMGFITNALCEAAGQGDLNLLRMLVTAGGNVNAADYDQRTALHLAAVEGQLLTVDYLVNTCHADVNMTDRWKSTAFQDALNSGHKDVAVMIQAAGGVLGPSCNPELMKELEDAPSIGFVHRKVAHLANRFHGRSWIKRGSTETVRRNDHGDNVFLGQITHHLVRFIPLLRESFMAMNEHVDGFFSEFELPITDTPATSALPTCALVRQGDKPVLDHAIIGLQRLLANRYAIKSKLKADSESVSSGGSTLKKKRKKGKKKDKGDGQEDEADDEGEYDEDEEEDDKIEKKKEKKKKGKSSRDAINREKRAKSYKLRREWSDEGEKSKGLARVLLKFGTKSSGLARTIASIYSVHESVSFQPVELQIPRILSKIRAVETDKDKNALLLRMQDDDSISVPRLLQSQLFRTMLMEAILRIEKDPKAGDVTYSKTLPDGTLINARQLDSRRRKAEAKNAALIDPNELLAACNTIDECFRLFDDDDSGEVSVEEMEQMQSLIGDFGEELIKELHRLSSVKEADEQGQVPGLTLEEFTGVFCSTMGLTMSEDEDEIESLQEEIDEKVDEKLVFNVSNNRRLSRLSAVSGVESENKMSKEEGDWVELAGALDEAATLNPVTTHEAAIQIAALTGKPTLVPHAKMDTAKEDLTSAAALVGNSQRSGSAYLNHVADISKRSGTASMAKGFPVGYVRGASATNIKDSPGDGSDGGEGGVGKESIDDRSTLQKLFMATFGTLQFWKMLVKGCFGYHSDSQAEEIKREFMVRIKDAFLIVLNEQDIADGDIMLDIKHLGRLMQSVTGGRAIPKPELEIMTKLFDPEVTGSVNMKSFSDGLMMLHGDPSLNRLLGQDLSRLLDQRSQHTESSTRLPDDASIFAIHPNNPGLKWFKTLVLWVSWFYFFEVPIRITFRVGHRLRTPYLVAVHCFDIILILDILVKFCTAYVNKKSVLTYDMQRISKHYLSTTFFMDAFAAFPFDLLAMMSTTRRSATSYIDYSLMGYLRIPKLLRLYRVYQVSKGSRTDIKSDSISGVLKRLIPMLLNLNHVAACVLWWASADTYIASGESDSMFLRWEGLGTDDIMNLKHSSSSELVSIAKQYLVSYFWVCATISTNGRIGDVNPITDTELVFTIIIMFLNMTVYAYALGEVSATVMKQDEDLVKQRQNILSVESYITSRQLPEDLSSQIRAHFDFLVKSANVNQSNEEEDIFTQLSHSLQVEVASYLSRDLIACCSAFKDIDEIFLDSMAVLLREVNMSSDQYLYRVNEVSRELFIISSGIVELTVENMVDGGDNVISIRQRGELCGELSFFFGIRQNTNARTSSSSVATFFCLPKEDYLQLLKLYPQEEENLTRNALAAFDDFSYGRDGTSSYASSSYSSEAGKRKMFGGGGSSAAGSEASSTALASNVDTNALDDIATVRKVLNVARQKKLNEKIVSLVTAAAKNDISEVARMLAQGDINVDMGDYDERTPLHLAASNGHLKMVKYLIQIHGADFNVKDRYGGTPMVDAIRHKHDNCAAFLRSQGASLALDDAAERLCSAAAKNDVAALRRLVENHVNPNEADYDKRTALHLAASEGSMDALRFLISIKGINVNPEDRLGGTPLADAIRHKQHEAQKLLRENGANLGNMDISVRMCEAGYANDLESIQTYIINGADLNAGDYDQRTALHLAASQGNLAALSWMLDNGGEGFNVNVLDRMRNTPLDDAIREGHKVCALLLAEKGGLQSSDPKMSEAKIELARNLESQKVLAEKERLTDAIKETEEIMAKSDMDKVLEELQVTTGSLWFNLAMLFNHFWTVTKLIFVYNAEPGYELLKADGYGNVPPDELEAQIQEIIGIINKLMTDNLRSGVENVSKMLSDPVVKRAEQDKRASLMKAGTLKKRVKLGKAKLDLLTTMLVDLKEECESHNYYLTRLAREVKREINIRISHRRNDKHRQWQRAKNMVATALTLGRKTEKTNPS